MPGALQLGAKMKSFKNSEHATPFRVAALGKHPVKTLPLEVGFLGHVSHAMSPGHCRQSRKHQLGIVLFKGNLDAGVEIGNGPIGMLAKFLELGFFMGNIRSLVFHLRFQ